MVITLQPAAARFEQGGEQLSRLVAVFRPGGLTQRLQLLVERLVGHAHPLGEAIADASRHFRRARLGERQAQDRIGVYALKQQTQHA